jgi:hypothetical protein
VAAFLGQAPNPLGATEPIADAEQLACNPRYAEERDAMFEALPDQLLRDEPWKHAAVAAGEAPWPPPHSTENPLEEEADLVSALAPLRVRLSGQENSAGSEQCLTAAQRSLEGLVTRVLHGLDRHGFQAAEQEG